MGMILTTYFITVIIQWMYLQHLAVKSAYPITASEQWQIFKHCLYLVMPVCIWLYMRGIIPRSACTSIEKWMDRHLP